ncbi:hypothetical protein, partial [Shinella sp.]|uniref:hypothetical protein n=1 Tax=Shinella sp. TaxID=1870904 RepID=UPI0040361AF6
LNQPATEPQNPLFQGQKNLSSFDDGQGEARTLLAEMAIDGLPNEPIDTISVELQDANRVPIVTFRLVLEAIPHGTQEL